MGCGNSKTKVSISQHYFWPVKNPYLIHHELKRSASIGVYNLNSKTYKEEFPNMPRLSSGCNFCWVDDENIIIGGGVFQLSVEVLDMHLINIIKLSVSKLPNLLSSHSDFILISHLGEIYAISGYNHMNRLSPNVEKCKLYKEWTACQKISLPRSNATGVSVSQNIYVLGGNSGFKSSAICDIIEEYNSVANSWRTINLVLPLPLAKIGYSKLNDNTVIFFGGETPRGNSFISFELDFSEFKYTETSQLPQSKDGWVFVFEGKAYKDCVYAIESRYKQFLIYENRIWKPIKLKPDFLIN